jgi:hypothetical protein
MRDNAPKTKAGIGTKVVTVGWNEPSWW